MMMAGFLNYESPKSRREPQEPERAKPFRIRTYEKGVNCSMGSEAGQKQNARCGWAVTGEKWVLG